jgi:hypothetical protein
VMSGRAKGMCLMMAVLSEPDVEPK